MLLYQPLIFLFIHNFFFTLKLELLKENDLILAIYRGENPILLIIDFSLFFSKQKAATCAQMRLIRSILFFFCNKRSILDTETDGDEKKCFPFASKKKKKKKGGDQRGQRGTCLRKRNHPNIRCFYILSVLTDQWQMRGECSGNLFENSH